MPSEQGRSWEHVCLLTVIGRPATFATAHEAPWKAAVRRAVAEAGLTPRADAAFRVRLQFRTPIPGSANERWDIDNLVKPTLDALEGVFGLREWKGVPQPNDDRVIALEASKRTAVESELPGAVIEVWSRSL